MSSRRAACILLGLGVSTMVGCSANVSTASRTPPSLLSGASDSVGAALMPNSQVEQQMWARVDARAADTAVATVDGDAGR